MRKFRAFNKGFADHCGRDLAEFLTDPRLSLRSGMYGEDVSDHIEDKLMRCFATQGRLIALLVEKNLITIEDGLEVTDITGDVSGWDIREVKE